jgi:hypothetical protein
MRFFFAAFLILILNLLSSCSSDAYDDELLNRLDKRLPKYNANINYKKNIPRYSNNEDLPIYKSPSEANNKYSADNIIYPTYDSEADNPIVPSIKDVSPMYEYPTYDPSADNPYYNGQSPESFNDRIYNDYYPTYDQGADNPAYPADNSGWYSYELKPTQKYQYPVYDSEADNPVVPSPPSNTLFDSPSFDSPMFEK